MNRPGSDRGISTVADVAVFLLLVTAAVGTLALPVRGPPADGAARPTADAVATATVDVTYDLTPPPDPTVPPDSGEYDRAAHGTLADLLATGAVEATTVDGMRPTRTYDGFRRAVANATRRLLRRLAGAGQVRVAWRPYPDAPIGGRFVVGDAPPPAATVDAARLTVPSGLPGARERALAAADEGYGAVARIVAADVVEGLFPPAKTRLALHGDPPVTTLTARRYRRFGCLLGANASAMDDALAAVETARANRLLRRALAGRLAADMASRFDSPRAAARAVRVARVEVVVRTWSP